MNMNFPSELFYKAMKYDTIGDVIQVEAMENLTKLFAILVPGLNRDYSVKGSKPHGSY